VYHGRCNLVAIQRALVVEEGRVGVDHLLVVALAIGEDDRRIRRRWVEQGLARVDRDVDCQESRDDDGTVGKDLFGQRDRRVERLEVKDNGQDHAARRRGRSTDEVQQVPKLVLPSNGDPRANRDNDDAHGRSFAVSARRFVRSCHVGFFQCFRLLAVITFQSFNILVSRFFRDLEVVLVEAKDQPLSNEEGWEHNDGKGNRDVELHEQEGQDDTTTARIEAQRGSSNSK